jgi:glycine/D-amino acid oxidase-like deaminating enzyme
VVVIGDGAVGLSIALACRERDSDASIAVIGPVGRPGAASPAAAAMLTAFAEVEPETLRDPGRRAKFELAHRSVPRWPDWIAAHADRAGLPVPIISPGTVVTATDPVVDGPVLAAISEAANSLDVAIQTLELRDVPGLRPRRTPPEAPAIRIPAEGAVDPLDVLRVLDGSATSSGITRIAGRAVRLDEHHLVLDTGETIRCRHLVVAAGARTSGLLETHPDLRGRVPRIRFGTGVGIRAVVDEAVELPREVVRTPNRRDGHGVYFAPHGTGRFYVGATCDIADEPVETPRIAALRRILDAAMDDLSQELGRATCHPVLGHRPTTDDGLPLLGRATGSIWVASGTHRDGLVSAPEIGDRMAMSMFDDVAGFDPALHPLRTGLATRGFA